MLRERLNRFFQRRPDLAESFIAPELGDRVKDPITGFTDIVTCITTWLHGCIRIGVQPEETKDGEPLPERHFDQSQLIVVDKRVHAPMVLSVVEAPAAETRRSNGGPAREGAGFAR
jgi:hypothetical protein